MKRLRCAIYTRKSSEEGLEQDFNSLHAQREACSAYVLSQASEGWVLVEGAYDDGGISGGTLERPGLQRLLSDIAAGQIDIVVVYKVDRLTRSLLDFARLVEAFDAAGTSFVSVTQAFNTTTSMGRLTLNMLLSFAQFEREVTAERIRDKIAASKARGMWMGGTPPLGYRPDGRSLAIVEAHAGLVRQIFARYLELGSVRLLADELIAQGIRVPTRTRTNGKVMGGGVFSRGQLYTILKNPTYAGDIAHRDRTYAGQHLAIIAREQWDKVQRSLVANLQGSERCASSPTAALLTGRIVDAGGEPMLTVHAKKGSVRYRYYVSRSRHLKQPGAAAGLRLPAREIDGIVRSSVAQLFDTPLELVARLPSAMAPHVMRDLESRCSDIAEQLRSRASEPLRRMVRQVTAAATELTIEIDVPALVEQLTDQPPATHLPPIMLTAPYRLTRSGQALRLIQDDGTRLSSQADPALLRLVLRARRWWEMLGRGEIDVRTLAKREGVNESYVTRVVRLAFLSPAVVEAVLAGRQMAGLSATIVRGGSGVPARWTEQESRYLPATSL